MSTSQRTLSSAVTLSVVRKEPRFIALTHQNLLLLLWSGPQEPGICRSLYGTAVQVAATTGLGKVAIVSIVAPGSSPPSKESRDALSQLHDDPQQVVHRSALVFRSAGIISGAIQRIAMSAMQRGSRRLKHDIFDHLDRAISWVTEGLPTANGQPISTSGTVAALEDYLSSSDTRVA